MDSDGTAVTWLAKAQCAEARRERARLAMAGAAAALALIAMPHSAGAASRHAERAVEEIASRAAGAPIMAIVSLKSAATKFGNNGPWVPGL
jgi:hypothetical protein